MAVWAHCVIETVSGCVGALKRDNVSGCVGTLRKRKTSGSALIFSVAVMVKTTFWITI